MQVQAGYTDLKDIAHQCICKQNYLNVDLEVFHLILTIFRSQQNQKFLIKMQVEFHSNFTSNSELKFYYFNFSLKKWQFFILPV